MTLGVRPEAIVEDPTGIDVDYRRTVTFGDHIEIELGIGANTLWMRTQPRPNPETVRFTHWHVFDANGEAVAHIA